VAEELKARLSVRVHPNARRTGFAGLMGDSYKLNIAAPPTDGRANEACIDFLAKFFGVRRAAVRLVSGQSSRAKVFEFDGLSLDHLRHKLESTS
jgi:uncharacterized protein